MSGSISGNFATGCPNGADEQRRVAAIDVVKIVRQTREMIESEGFGPSFHTRCFPKDPAELAARRRSTGNANPNGIADSPGIGAGVLMAPRSSLAGGVLVQTNAKDRRPSKTPAAGHTSNGGQRASLCFTSPTSSSLKSPPARPQQRAEELVDESPWHPLLTNAGFDFQMQPLHVTRSTSSAMPAIVVDCADGKRALSIPNEASVFVEETVVCKEVLQKPP